MDLESRDPNNPVLTNRQTSLPIRDIEHLIVYKEHNHEMPFLYARLQTGRIMVWWCLSVRVSVRPTLRPSVRVSVRQFSTLFSNMLWHIELKFCILHMTLCYCNTDQVRVSSICVNFCGSYAPFWTYNTWNTVFRTFLLHALTYWAEIFHMTLFNVLQIKFEWRHSVSIHFIWNLKFDVGLMHFFKKSIK